MSEIRIKRVYDAPEAADGWRVLIDRVWPRGRTKEEVACDLWAKEVTPSTTLRRALHSGDLAPEEFARAYRDELAHASAFPAFVDAVHEALGRGNVTLLTAARLMPHGHCEVLRQAITTSGSAHD